MGWVSFGVGGVGGRASGGRDQEGRRAERDGGRERETEEMRRGREEGGFMQDS